VLGHAILAKVVAAECYTVHHTHRGCPRRGM